jgi:hypothetical protein
MIKSALFDPTPPEPDDPQNDAAPLAGGAGVNGLNSSHQRTPLALALAYAERGWPVIPVHRAQKRGAELVCSCSKGANCPRSNAGKHPRTRHGIKDATIDLETIRAWWARWPGANVGIATGAVSGLVVLDIDPRNGGDDTLAELLNTLGQLPSTVEALTGGDGRHLLFRDPGGRIASTLGAGVDVKADGGFIVAAPSVHPSGRAYAWELSSDPEDVPVASLPETWVRRLRQGNTEGPFCIPVSPVSLHSPVSRSEDGMPDDVAELLRQTLPKGPGKRREGVSRFARGVKLDLGRTETDELTLRRWVRIWHDAAWPMTSQTKSFDDTWNDFESWWRDARFALKTSPGALALAAAEKGRPWPEFGRWEHESYRLLVAICREMQRLAGDAPFALSCHHAGAMTGVPHGLAYTRLHSLTRGERPVLECVSRGVQGPGGRANTASRWRFLGV